MIGREIIPGGWYVLVLLNVVTKSYFGQRPYEWGTALVWLIRGLYFCQKQLKNDTNIRRVCSSSIFEKLTPSFSIASIVGASERAKSILECPQRGRCS